MILNLIPERVYGLPPEERVMLRNLIDTYEDHAPKNREKQRYYEGKISLDRVNLGIALPKGMQGLEIGCAWGAKTVDVLAARSMFDGFVGMNGQTVEELDRLVRANDLLTEYQKACRDELKFGCTFATLSKDERLGCKIRFHSPQTAAAVWDGDQGRIAYGLAVIATAKDPDDHWEEKASLVYLYTPEAVWVLAWQGWERWTAQPYSIKMGRPMMEPLVWAATSLKPFGRSRIKEPVRRLIDGYVRTVANASIGLEFSTAPQKYLLGVTDEQYQAVTSDKFRQYVGAIIAGTTNPDTGEKPTFGQLPQGSIQPHVDMLRMLSTQFSAATGLTVTDTGVINDANPTSSDAILAQSQTLVGMAEQLNSGNGHALQTIAIMAQAVAQDVRPDELTDEQLAIEAHFKNPAMPSVAVTADAAVKIASVREGFASTDVFLEMLGFSAADIRRINAQERRVRGAATLEELGIG